MVIDHIAPGEKYLVAGQANETLKLMGAGFAKESALHGAVEHGGHVLQALASRLSPEHLHIS